MQILKTLKMFKNEMILDIGPKTIEKINKTIDISKTVLWNGPAGYFENKIFKWNYFNSKKNFS